MTPEEMAERLCRLEVLERQTGIQGWIKTLWPIITAIIAVAMLYQSLASRVSYLESGRLANAAAIVVLQQNQSTMMSDISSLRANMETLTVNTEWMRNHWPGNNGGN